MTTICDFFLSMVPCVITSALLEPTNNIFTLMKNVTLKSDAILSGEAAVKVTAPDAIIDLNKKVFSGVDLDSSSTIGFLLDSPEVTIKNGQVDGFHYGIETNDVGSGNIVNVHMSNQIFNAVLHSGTSFNIDRSTFDCIGKSCIYLEGLGPYSISNSIIKPTVTNTIFGTAISVGRAKGNKELSIKNNLIEDMGYGVGLSGGLLSKSNIIIESNCIERNRKYGLFYRNQFRISDGTPGTIDIKNNFITSNNDANAGIVLDKSCFAPTCSDVPPNVINNCIGGTEDERGPGLWLKNSVIPGTVIYDNTFYNNINRGDVCEGDEATCISTNNGLFLSQRDNDDEARARCVCPLNESNVGAGSMPVIDDDDDDEEDEPLSSSSSSRSDNSSKKKKKKNKSSLSSFRKKKPNKSKAPKTKAPSTKSF